MPIGANEQTALNTAFVLECHLMTYAVRQVGYNSILSF